MFLGERAKNNNDKVITLKHKLKGNRELVNLVSTIDYDCQLD